MIWAAIIVASLSAAPFLTQAEADAYYELLCSRTDVAIIRNDDPALKLFRRPNYPLKDAKIDLADERANGCQNVIDKEERDQRAAATIARGEIR